MSKLVSLAAVLVMSIALSAPARAWYTSPAQTYEEGEKAQASPVAVVDWRVPDRYSVVPRTFDDVNPAAWRVQVDTCKSYSRTGEVTSIRWRMFDLDGGQLVDTTTCSRWVTVRSLGSYRVRITVNATDGTVTTDRWIQVRDHLIVVAGDSMASGEGNPDTPGHARFEICGATVDPSSPLPEFGLDPLCIRDILKILDGDVPSLVDAQPSTWRLDPDCHRSYNSGLSKAARDIETRDPRSSVTFINVACSGAETRHVHRDSYEGVYDSGAWDTGTKQPQAEQIARLVCGGVGSCDGDRVRPVDGLFLSIGINDLHFSDVLNDCKWPDYKQILGVDGCHDSSADEMDEALAALTYDGAFRAIDRRFAALDLPIRSVYHSLYPTEVFSGAPFSCGIFNFVNPMERSWLQEVNLRLNQEVRSTLNTTLDWDPTFRDWSTNPWSGHGYCAGSDRYFVSLFDSILKVNGLGKKVINGAVHPNARGHEVLRSEFLNEYDQRNRPVTDHLVVTIEGARVTGVEKAHGGWLVFGAGRQGTDGAVRAGTSRALRIPDDVDVRPGTWVDLSGRNIRLQLGLNDVEKLRLGLHSANYLPPLETDCPHPDSGETTYRAAKDDGGDGPSDVPCILPVVKGFHITRTYTDDGDWGIGVSKTVTDDTGRFTVRYRISRPDCVRCVPGGTQSTTN